MEMPPAASAEGVQSATGVSVVGVDEEVAVFFAQEHEKEVEIDPRHFGDGDDVQCAGAIGVPLVERQHEGETAGNLQPARLQGNEFRISSTIGMRHCRSEIHALIIGQKELGRIGGAGAGHGPALEIHDGHSLTIFTAWPTDVLHIGQVAPGLRVVARAADGTIEAVEMPGHPWLIGVQWHPEMTAAQDAIQQRLFDALVQVAAQRRRKS